MSTLLDRALRLPRWGQVLLVWAASTSLTLVILRLSAQDTGATPWAGPAPSWAEHLRFWDSGWYERVSRQGYPTRLPVNQDGRVAPSTWAFMPGLPVLAGLLGWTGASFYVRAAVVAVLASAGAAVVMDRWLAPKVGASTSLMGVALMWCSPCAAVLQVPYAESLGLLLVGGALWQAESRHWGAAAVLVALAAVSRPVGLPLATALGLWWLWETLLARGWVGARASRLLPGHRVLSASERARLVVLTVWAGACALAWPFAAWVRTGRPSAYTDTETAWRATELLPFTAWVIRAQEWLSPHLGVLLVVTVLLVMALCLSMRSLRLLGPAAWFWCAGYLLYLLAFFDPTTSVFRILLPLAPCAWAVARELTGWRRRMLALAVCLIAQLTWVSWAWDMSEQIRWIP